MHTQVTPDPTASTTPRCWECQEPATHWKAWRDASGWKFSANGGGYGLPLCDAHDDHRDTEEDAEMPGAMLAVLRWPLAALLPSGKLVDACGQVAR